MALLVLNSYFTLDDGKDADGKTQEERLKNLSDFQISIIEHALKCKLGNILLETCH